MNETRTHGLCPECGLSRDLAEDHDRLRAENERLAGIIANVCLALGYEESAWPCHWRTAKEQ